MTGRRCSVCGDPWHDKRHHVAPAGDLITGLSEAPPQRRETERDLTHQALREAVRGVVAELPRGAGLPPTEPEPDVDPDDPALITPPWRTAAGADGPIRVTQPGLYHLTAKEYHDPAVTGDWISNTDGKAITAPGCPAQWKFDRDHGIRRETPAMMFGKLAHRIVLGCGEDIAVRPDEWADWRTKAAQAWRTEQQDAGRIVVTPAEYAVAEDMAAALLRDEDAAPILAQPGRSEACLFWHCPVTGVRRRAMIDHLPHTPPEGRRMVLGEYKTTEHPCPDDEMTRTLYRLGYHRQNAGYVDGVTALGLAPDGVVMPFIMQSTRKPYLVTLIRFDDRALQIGAIENRRALETFARCLATDEWPKYADGVRLVGVPGWIERLYDGEI